MVQWFSLLTWINVAGFDWCHTVCTYRQLSQRDTDSHEQASLKYNHPCCKISEWWMFGYWSLPLTGTLAQVKCLQLATRFVSHECNQMSKDSKVMRRGVWESAVNSFKLGWFVHLYDTWTYETPQEVKDLDLHLFFAFICIYPMYVYMRVCRRRTGELHHLGCCAEGR